MERLTRLNINVDHGTDRFLHAAIGGKEIDWKQCRDSTLNVLLNGPTSNGFGKDIFRKMVRDLYGRLKAYEDIAELCGGIDRLRELAEADKDGRVVVLPVKLGTKVYAIHFNIHDFGDKSEFEIVEKNFELRDCVAFGKAIFASREEAEKAMEAMKDG